LISKGIAKKRGNRGKRKSGKAKFEKTVRKTSSGGGVTGLRKKGVPAKFTKGGRGTSSATPGWFGCRLEESP